MKKFIFSNVFLIVFFSMLLWIGIKKMPDNGMFRHGSYKELSDCTALFSKIGIDHKYSDAKEYEALIRNFYDSSDADEFDILYVTSTNDNYYSVRSSSYSFHVNKVIEGNVDLNGKDIHAQIESQSFFQELEPNSMKRMKDFFNSKGFSEEEYPWLYNNKEVCYSYTNVPKEGDNYIVFIAEYRYNDNKDPLFLLLNRLMFPEADTSNDVLLKIDDIPIYKNYSDNYTFFYKQEDLDWYIALKNDIFDYYLA